MVTMVGLAILEDAPIRVTADGRWLHGDQPLHPRVEALFKRSVVPAADGSYRLVVGAQQAELEVADTAFAVTTLELSEAEGELCAVRLTISDGAEELLDPDSLEAAPDHTLTCHIVRHGVRVRCRIPPRHYYPLALRMEMDGDRAVLPIAGRRVPVGRR